MNLVEKKVFLCYIVLKTKTWCFMKIDLNKILAKRILPRNGEELVKKIYEESFPENEREDFENLYNGGGTNINSLDFFREEN